MSVSTSCKRFTGACYRAANWIEVGTTKGCGKLEKTHQRVLPLDHKSLFIRVFHEIRGSHL